MSRGVEITLLTQDDCAFCGVAKEILTRVRHDYSLRVREIDLATAEGQRLAASAGVLFAPGVLINGQAFSYGRLSERKLRRALGRQNTA
ncbi:glutaredoxin family protein [Pseudonocardia nigra]|uniref:glutaredoxin family protein n=1 Tax=Pseudonocardia nigra TaxID=1921578 RepID=UPI001C5E3C39|nr:glutaredoxin family protein [Pseudonocardia nigra]